MNYIDEIKNDLREEWIPQIYAEKVRLQRTRSFEFDIPEHENKTEILHTLLGIELKVGNRRFSCPDLATARYLRVFARIGCPRVAIPYDITKISVIADELEVAWHKLLLFIEKTAKNRSPQARGRIKSALMKQVRREIKELGAGEAMPAFKQSTKQRSS